jgi:WD40 repeat protein
MRGTVAGRWVVGALAVAVVGGGAAGAEPNLARKAEAILKANCYRCHGQEGAVEGGFNYVLDRSTLVARKKVVPGRAGDSPLYKKLAAGKMPPPGEAPRPSAADVALIKEWIEAGALPVRPAVERPVLSEAALYDRILADLDRIEPRSRRFTRYFSLLPLANAGHGPDELQTYRNALSKLLNSLSWHPRITLPKPVDPEGLLLRIDLRDYQWDANLWNRLLAEYPYGVLHDTAVARAVLVATATRMPCVRLDWFVATASRPPLYYDLLQIPANAAELERQLRVDVNLDVQQERVARAGFNGSGISRNNRVLERHDAQTGVYWRTYDFEAVPQNLLERNILLPDRRNIFAYPLGPGASESLFLHAGGEIIFNLPNGLQGYMLVNANNQRIDKGPTAIVSDAKRPDRAVEVGISCLSCHAGGINFKDDQIRDHVAKNAKSFSRADAALVRALYVPKERMRALMEEDAARFRKALEKTGNKVSPSEVIMTMALRYEADVDLPTLAAEAGVKAEELQARLSRSEALARNLGALKVPGATVARQVVVQAFGDVARELRLGGVFQAGAVGESLPDNTGDIDPLEAQSSPANAAAFSPDGRLAALAGADKSVRLWDVEAGRDLRRCIGHTASVWCVAFSPDGTQLLSGGKDGTLRLWDVETGRELRKLEGHDDLVTAVAFSPDGHRALSAGYDHCVQLWDLDKGEAVPGFEITGGVRYVNGVALSGDGKWGLVCAGQTVYLIDAKTGKELRRCNGHAGSVVAASFSPDGRHVLSGGDDRTLRLWERATGKPVRTFMGHESYVKSVAFAPDGRSALSGGSDGTVRLWDVTTGKELRVFRKHSEPLVAVTFTAGGAATLSCSRDGAVHQWRLRKANDSPSVQRPAAVETIAAAKELRPLVVIPVGGTVGSLHLSPDRRWLYYFNRTDSTLGQVDAQDGRRLRTLRLAEGADAVSLSHDGKRLVALAPGREDESRSTIQVIDAPKLELKKSFTVEVSAYDVATGDNGLVFVSGARGAWADVGVIDVGRQAVVGRWGGVWARSLLRLTPDGQRLYHSSQGVTPGTLERFDLPSKPADKPVATRASVGRHALGGEFVLSPDGHFLLCKTGTVLRLAAERDNDMRPHADLGPFLDAAVDPEAQAAFVLARDGTLRRYSYPDFRPQETYRLALSAYRLALDARGRRLYVAGFDPKAVSDRPRARGYGDVHVYALK